MIAISTLFAILITNIGHMVSLIGAVCGLALIYVIPVSVHIKSKHMQIQNDEN